LNKYASPLPTDAGVLKYPSSLVLSIITQVFPATGSKLPVST
jgi:hypothetical protein